MTDGYGIFNVHTHSLNEELHDGLSPKYKIHRLRPAKFKLTPMAREPGFSRGKLHTLTQTQLGQFLFKAHKDGNTKDTTDTATLHK